MTTTPATERQVGYIAELAAEVEDRYGYASLGKSLYRATQRARFHGSTKQEASRTIRALLALLARDDVDTP